MDERPDKNRENEMPEERPGFTDGSFISHDQAPQPPRSYSYTGPEIRESRQRWEKEERKAEKSGMSAGAIVALCLVCSLLGGAFGRFTGPRPEANPAAETSAPATENEEAAVDAEQTPAQEDTSAKGESTEQTLTASPDEKDEQLAATEIYNIACRQVVGISTEMSYNTYYGTRSGTVTGSGFIISSDGYILTNYHVVQYAAEGGYPVTVMLYSGESYPATLVGYEDDDSDVAVLKIEATGLEAATLGNSESISVGETIYAVGNPLGELDYTMTKGMISAMDREITTGDTGTSINMFQIDAAVNSGNSGGPVYNMAGQVVGIVTAKYSDSYEEMGIEGLGFAIPIDDAVSIANDLIKNGYVQGKAYLGISTKSVSTAAAQYYNMVEGAYVYAVVEGSCAQTAGIRMGDIITAMDNTKISSVTDLQSALKQYSAGDSAALTVFRNGEKLTLTVIFDEKRPTFTSAAQSEQSPFGYGYKEYESN